MANHVRAARSGFAALVFVVAIYILVK
jgi:hypothetical protein